MPRDEVERIIVALENEVEFARTRVASLEASLRALKTDYVDLFLLHEPLLDRNKPLWELHVIDGIRGRKFAAYLKLHHAYADGVTMTSWLSKTLAPEPAPDSYTPPWSMDTCIRVGIAKAAAVTNRPMAILRSGVSG